MRAEGAKKVVLDKDTRKHKQIATQEKPTTAERELAALRKTLKESKRLYLAKLAKKKKADEKSWVHDAEEEQVQSGDDTDVTLSNKDNTDDSEDEFIHID